MEQEEIKKNLNHPVLYDGKEYLFKECVLWINQKERKFVYSASLLDKKCNCIIRVPLEKVNEIKVTEDE